MRGDRCEGIYIKEVSATLLQIVSFTESYAEFEHASGKALRLEWDKSPGNDDVQLRVLVFRTLTSGPWMFAPSCGYCPHRA